MKKWHLLCYNEPTLHILQVVIGNAEIPAGVGNDNKRLFNEMTELCRLFHLHQESNEAIISLNIPQWKH